MGSCVWAFIDPRETRVPNAKGYRARGGWRRANVFAWGPKFGGRVWVKLDRPIAGQDAEVALRISIASRKPTTKGAGMTPAEFMRRAGKMGKYQLESCIKEGWA
jgi:hypothetical protein